MLQPKWDQTLEQPSTPGTDRAALRNVIVVLENQLFELDRMRLHIGAAHLAAAIEHLRILHDSIALSDKT